ncbi:hypothetical protein GIB67_021296 [Kingdonia uniflora]|uniref:RRM domain-containing protein n=1 Tax=Kingdonia uniflora TaxID=39325 RepID=A0A7J7LY49_9MAGN|nr:hypothetical protein GIB67_021296 [Kingdonia uniflora]
MTNTFCGYYAQVVNRDPSGSPMPISSNIMKAANIFGVDVTSNLLGLDFGVNLKLPVQGERAINKLNNTALEGSVMRVMWSQHDPTARKSGIGNVFVKNLSAWIDTIRLHEIFIEYGNISSCKVQMSEGKNMGYGFVQFESELSANAAIENLNGTTIDGKQIHVGNFVRKSDRIAKYTNLYIKNLDVNITEERLREKFSQFGEITSIAIMKDDDSNSKGYGFVNFKNTEHAKSAVEAMNGAEFGFKNIYVGRAQKKAERQQILLQQFMERPNLNYTNLYVKNLDPEVNIDILKAKFSPFGEITSMVIMNDDSGNSKGYGFVNYKEPGHAKLAMDLLNGTELGLKTIYVGRAQKKSERKLFLCRKYEKRRKETLQKYKGANLYVKYIHADVDDDELRSIFSQCGTITSSKVMRHPNGVSKGFGFVCFTTHEEANHALITLNRCIIHGKPLYVAIAQTKEERLAQYQSQFFQHLSGAGNTSVIIPAGYNPFSYEYHLQSLVNSPSKAGLFQGGVSNEVAPPPWQALSAKLKEVVQAAAGPTSSSS